jgi:hypothetical protein
MYHAHLHYNRWSVLVHELPIYLENCVLTAESMEEEANDLLIGWHLFSNTNSNILDLLLHPGRTIRLLDPIRSYLNPGWGPTNGSLVLKLMSDPPLWFDRMSVEFRREGSISGYTTWILSADRILSDSIDFVVGFKCIVESNHLCVWVKVYFFVEIYCILIFQDE